MRVLRVCGSGEAVIQHIRATRPGYNLISNNCQTYVLQLLDAIKVSQVKEFGTTLAVYERLFGTGKVADLFVDGDGNLQSSSGPQGEATVVSPIEGQELGVVGGTGGNGHVPYHRPDALLHQVQDGAAVPPQQNSVLFAQQVMNANTTQLNAQEEMDRGMREGDETPPREGKEAKEPKEGSWTVRTNSFFRKFKK